MKQIKFYNNFIRFLARLAEVVISLLRTLKNNLSDLVVTFARSAFQRRSAVIKVFLVSVVAVLGGTWQDLDILGHGLSESGVKYGLLPFFVKIKNRLSNKAKKDTGVNKVINEMNRLSESMKGKSNAKKYEIFKQILAKENALNKALREIDEPDIRFQGPKSRTGDEAVSYGEGLHNLGVLLDLSEDATDLEGVFSTFPNTYFSDLDKRFRSGKKLTDPQDIKWGRFTRSLIQTKNNIKQVHNNLAKDRGFYRYVWPDDHPIYPGRKQPPPGFILHHVKGNKQQKIKKLIAMKAELERNPRAFYQKYAVRIKNDHGFYASDLPDTPLPRPKGDRAKPETQTNILTEEALGGWGRYPLAVPRRKENELRFDDDKEIQAKKQREYEEKKAELDKVKGILDEDVYEFQLKRLAGKLESDGVRDVLKSVGINLDNYPSISKNTTPTEAFRALKGRDKDRFQTALVDGDILSNKYPYLRVPDTISSDGMLTEDTLLNKAKIIPDEDGSIPVRFNGSVLEDVDATDVTDWSETKFGDVKDGSVAVLRGMQLSEEGAKSFKKHHDDKIHLLSEETIEKYKEIFGDYPNRQ